MIKFKEFVKKNISDKKIPILNTVFGNHSRKKDYIPILNTKFGKGSIKEESINEASADSELKRHYEFNTGEKQAIKSYTNDSFALNNSLHKQSTGHDVPEHPLQKPMDKVVMKHRTPKPLMVYSGVHTSPEHAHSSHGDEHGVTVRTTNFTSTSLSKNRADYFADKDKNSKYNKSHSKPAWEGDEHPEPPTHRLRIHIPAGHHGAYVDHHSKNKGEKEFILPRGTHMHIKPHPTYDSKNHSMEWEAHVIPHDK